ncbi:MAG: YicC family protein [Deltaproteobacteria bacterium]|nr:YicC family protein [Deltaproteobacteria bacterium]
MSPPTSAKAKRGHPATPELHNVAAVESMTGFGEHRTKIAGTTVTCRVRTLNHRFLDIKLRLPRPDLMTLDMAIRKRLAEVLKRGSVEITLSVESSRDAQEATAATINDKVAAGYAQACRALAKKLKLPAQALTLDALLRLPGVVGTNASQPIEEFLGGATDADIMQAAVEPALRALKKARQAEGSKLCQMLLKHLDEMEAHVDAIKALEAPEKEKARKLIIERAQDTLKLLGSLSQAATSDEFSARLREEAVFWIERRDFDEERERLAMHLKEFRKLLISPALGDASGRRLEFVQQEVLREINTLGTKAQSPPITTRTIELKTILERIREQLANVE